jgi:hypothetical protein
MALILTKKTGRSKLINLNYSVTSIENRLLTLKKRKKSRKALLKKQFDQKKTTQKARKRKSIAK